MSINRFFSTAGLCIFLAVTLLLASSCIDAAVSKPSPGAISIYTANPLYFQDAKGKPMVLIGDYPHDTFFCVDFPSVDSHYIEVFDSLKGRGLNITRVWLWWGREREGQPLPPGLSPFLRTGPGLANDGKPKYDLDKFDPAFFNRLRVMCKEADKREINLQLILMDAWMMSDPDLWRMHAFNRDNNVNGVDGDPRNFGNGTDGEQGFCSPGNPKAFQYQKAYILKVVDTVNEFDNVYFEVANEDFFSEAWELSLCDAIKEHERNLARQHMTIRRDFPSHFYVVHTWDISAVHSGIMSLRHMKVPLIFDTDWCYENDDEKVRRAGWTALASGGHFNYQYDSIKLRTGAPDDSRTRLCNQLGYMARFMAGIKPWDMMPDDSLVKSGQAFALVNPKALFVYLPYGGDITLDLSAMKKNAKARWYNPRSGVYGREFEVAVGPNINISAPDKNDWSLLVRSN